MEMSRTEARMLAAQAWCAKKTAHKVMDPDLAEAFADILLGLDIRRQRLRQGPELARIEAEEAERK